MGHTNSTANLSLPQFIGTDKPTWLGDVNGAFSAIDSYAGTNDAAVAAAVSDASSAVSQAAAAVNTANTANTTAGNASTAANNAIGVANTANAIAGAVDAKVGLLADLNTTDRSSIVNAINEVFGTISDEISVTADGIKTCSQILDDLHAALDLSKIKPGSTFMYAGGGYSYYFNLNNVDPSNVLTFTKCESTNTQTIIDTVNITASGSVFNKAVNDASTVTVTDNSSTIIPAGYIFKIKY